MSRDYMGYGEEEEEQDTDRHRMHYGCRLMEYSRRSGSVCQKSIVLDKLEERREHFLIVFLPRVVLCEPFDLLWRIN